MNEQYRALLDQSLNNSIWEEFYYGTGEEIHSALQSEMIENGKYKIQFIYYPRILFKNFTTSIYLGDKLVTTIKLKYKPSKQLFKAMLKREKEILKAEKEKHLKNALME